MLRWYLFSRWEGGIVSRCLRGIHPLGGGHRVLISPRYPFFLLGGGVVPRCLRVIPFSVGGGASCLDVSPVSLFSFGGSSLPDVPAVSVFSLGSGNCVSMSRRYPFCLGERGKLFRWFIGISFSVGGWALCSDTPAVSLFPSGTGSILPMFPWYRFSRWRGGHRVSMSPRYAVSLFPLEGGHRVLISTWYTFFSVGQKTSCPNISAVSLFSLGWGGIVSRCLRSIPFPVRGADRVPMFLGYSFFL